jgi:hypothetical protein
MKKIALSYPKRKGCAHLHDKAGYKENCQYCKRLHKERLDSFHDKTTMEAYTIINKSWLEILSRVEKKHKKRQGKYFCVCAAEKIITRCKCPWNSKLGLRIWRKVLRELQRLKEEYYIPVAQSGKILW